MRHRTLTREELYQRVWEQPAEQVAQELGISGVALTKRCAALNIPKPPRGYWQQLKSGKPLERPPLPQDATPRRRPRPPAPPFTPPAPPQSQLPPRVRATAAALAKAPTDRYGRLIRPHRAEVLDLRVSRDSLDRAVHLMGLFLAQAPLAECQVDLTPKATQLTFQGQRWRLSLKEKADRVPPPEPLPPLKHPWDAHTYPLARPNGRLMFVFEPEATWGERTEFADGRVPLEDQLPQIFRELPRLAQAQAAREKRRAQEHRRLQRQWEREAQQRRRREEEQACRQVLTAQAAAWAQQEQLSVYLRAAEAELARHPSPEGEAWLTWVRAAAVALDPLRNGELHSLTKRVRRLLAAPFQQEDEEDDILS